MNAPYVTGKVKVSKRPRCSSQEYADNEGKVKDRQSLKAFTFNVVFFSVTSTGIWALENCLCILFSIFLGSQLLDSVWRHYKRKNTS
jgi:hypothetical protein